MSHVLCLTTNRSSVPVPICYRKLPMNKLCTVQAFPSRGDDHVQDNNSMLQQNELITFITADGIMQIPGRPYYVPRQCRKSQQPMPTWEEQLLCIGQTFQVAAWSKDPNRCVMQAYYHILLLSWVVWVSTAIHAVWASPSLFEAAIA